MLSLQGSREASVCKYGVHLLRAALPADDKKAPPWATFLLLYELLDEYALHLIQVRWPSLIQPALDLIHPDFPHNV